VNLTKYFEKYSREVVVLTCNHANQPTISLPFDAYEVSANLPQLVIVYSQEKRLPEILTMPKARSKNTKEIFVMLRHSSAPVDRCFGTQEPSL